MRKMIILNAVLVTLLMSACVNPFSRRLYQQPAPSNINTGSTQKPSTDTEEPIKDTEDPDNKQDEETVIEGTHIENISCGYISVSPRPDDYVLYLVEDEADIEAAEDKLGMKVPENPDHSWEYSSGLTDVFRDFKDKYPIEEYAYLFIYEEHGCLGYKSHADKVVYRGDCIYFHYDVSEGPNPGESVCDAMDGEFKIAAIPKDVLKGKTFVNVMRPSQLENNN